MLHASDSPFESGSPEDFGWVSAYVGNIPALQRLINATAERILARGDEKEMDEKNMTVDEAVAQALKHAARINAEEPYEEEPHE